MQSIYRFRNAEVGLFLDIRAGGLARPAELEPLTLAVNFRSTRAGGRVGERSASRRCCRPWTTCCAAR